MTDNTNKLETFKLIDGKKIASKIKKKITKEVAEIIDNIDKSLHLAAIIVGEEPLSKSSLSEKEKACKEAGIIFSLYKFHASVKEKELLDLIEFLNNDDEVNGLTVQLPLPEHISEEKVISCISPKKDVNGMHPINLGKLTIGLPTFLPLVPNAVMELIKHYKIETEGKNCVILGNSNYVGKPLSILMSQKSKHGNATVTLCNSETKNLKKICASADILIAAIDKCEFVTADMVKNKAVVIDTGSHRIPSDNNEEDFILKGDVKFDEVSKKTSYITPVPDGVEPMIIASLLINVLKAFNADN